MHSQTPLLRLPAGPLVPRPSRPFPPGPAPRTPESGPARKAPRRVGWDNTGDWAKYTGTRGAASASDQAPGSHAPAAAHPGHGGAADAPTHGRRTWDDPRDRLYAKPRANVSWIQEWSHRAGR